MSWEGDDINLDIIVDDNGHGFSSISPYNLLSFIWRALDYGEFRQAADNLPGSFTAFD